MTDVPASLVVRGDYIPAKLLLSVPLPLPRQPAVTSRGVLLCRPSWFHDVRNRCCLCSAAGNRVAVMCAAAAAPMTTAAACRDAAYSTAWTDRPFPSPPRTSVARPWYGIQHRALLRPPCAGRPTRSLSRTAAASVQVVSRRPWLDASWRLGSWMDSSACGDREKRGKHEVLESQRERRPRLDSSRFGESVSSVLVKQPQR
ncbi:uncharacterized protein LOC125555430 [Triticum urartu]|uniref:uncharacterized protein LOC125555430 n=1 Tax=Triticum urartu TaxID=4572 RepID=UPI00204385F7|nr:uncharacterized protein LOC125555430 [Triticum urartu]